jgi:hypothetical protein
MADYRLTLSLIEGAMAGSRKYGRLRKKTFRRKRRRTHRGGSSYPMTCVSGYYSVTNKHGTNYNDWFKNTLAINCPYVFFGSKETIEMVKPFREGLPTTYVEHNLPEFTTYKYKDRMASDPMHCPSIELNLVWHEKIYMLKKAAELNPYNSEWFQWVDAGICIYRGEKPPTIEYPNRQKLESLPKDKLIYSSSHHHEPGTPVESLPDRHHIAATSYILHKSFIDKFVKLYTEYLDKLLDPKILWTEQILMTKMYEDHPELFHRMSHDYGVLTRDLY